MKVISAITVSFSIASLALSVPAMAVPVEQHVESIVFHLVGQMDTSAQAATDPDAPSVRMTTCKVQVPEKAPLTFLYQEQALIQKLEQPYRQRFLQIIPTADGKRLESKSFKPKNPEKWVGLCDKSESDRALTFSDLDAEVCSVFIRPLVNVYVGQTQPEGCPANVRGAVKITNTIILHSQGMDTWDRGFDTQNNQVWGAKNKPYQYRWLQKQN